MSITAEMLLSEFIKIHEKHIQAALVEVYPLPPKAAAKSFDALLLLKEGGVRVPSKSVMDNLDKHTETKIASIHACGSGYTGHGPTTSLNGTCGMPNVMHCHVTNGTGIGFAWAGTTLTVVAIGEKSDSAPSGTSGYAWTK